MAYTESYSGEFSVCVCAILISVPEYIPIVIYVVESGISLLNSRISQLQKNTLSIDHQNTLHPLRIPSVIPLFCEAELTA